MRIEFAIYNEKSKDDIIEFQNNGIIIPPYISWVLNILKIIYYQLHMISLSNYSYLKEKIFAFIRNDGKEEQFIVLRDTKVR